MRRAFATILTLAAFTALTSTAVAGNRIVGGSDTPITSAPWQVLVYVNFQGWSYCGGAILDATHVVTAAHCAHTNIENPNSAVLSPSVFTIVAGTTRVNPSAPAPANTDTTVSFTGVSKVVPDPRYDGTDYDATVLTLSSPLTLDGTYRKAIPLASAATAPGTTLTVSGWGNTQGGDNLSWPGYPNAGNLRSTTVHSVGYAQCNGAALYNGTLGPNETLICAYDAGRDSCAGDSGGPLTNAAGELVGIVSGGPINCGADIAPGYYTYFANCQVRGFVYSQIPGSGPTACTFPGIAGPPAIGSVLTCSAGTYASTVAALSYVFTDQAGNTLQTGPANAYTVTKADGSAQRTISCRVTAQDANGASTIGTASGVGPIPPPPVDRTRPTSSVTYGKCTRTQCILRLTVSDLDYSEGIASLRASRKTTVTLKKICKVKGKRRHCTRTTSKTLTATKTSSGYTVKASNLPYGKHRFTFTAVDVAGNTQSPATTRTLTTHAPKKR